jgi:NAD(P)H-hydrate repair Nnr-like enzyme with NAD(P)H-hydrate dehydratase domain
MDTPYWRQQADKPLFPELEWSRPENKLQAGKLLIIGGNKFGFVEPAEAFSAAEKAGAGTCRMLLPDSLKPFVGKTFAAGTLSPSTPSGSFSGRALADFVDNASWADAVLVAGGIGRNSETTVLFETFLEKYTGPVTLTKDAADIFCQQPITMLHRPDTLLVLAMGQLRLLGSEAHFPRAFTSDMGLVQLVDALHEFTKRFSLAIITRHQNNYIVAIDGQISTTPIRHETPVWRVNTAARASVWWLQNPNKRFEALTTAVYAV